MIHSSPTETGHRTPAEGSRRLRELEALHSIAGVVHGSLELEQVLSHALEQVLALFELDAGVVRLLDVSTGDLILAASASPTVVLVDELAHTARIGEGTGGLAARERAIAVIDDLATGEFAESTWARAGFHTFVAAPLLCKGMLV
ncbi:MAG: hypothetical protein K0Q72_3983, partial [Armatimonadetes bacterium]|nr:hypothetical protein [Armatimonadota bacterium]